MHVLIIDSSVQILERLKELLSEEKSISKIDKVVSYDGAKHFIRKSNSSVVLLDSGLPGNGTIKIIKEIKKSGSKTKIIVLANRIDESIQRKCKSLGVDFFFDKYHEFQKIPGVIKTIAAGGNEQDEK